MSTAPTSTTSSESARRNAESEEFAPTSTTTSEGKIQNEPTQMKTPEQVNITRTPPRITFGEKREGETIIGKT